MIDEKCCAPVPSLTDRSLLTNADADEITLLFKVLANDTRLRILHYLTLEPDKSVGEIAAALEMKVQAISNQLQKLVDQKIIKASRHGNFIHYEIIDDCTSILLERAWCLAEDTGKLNKTGVAQENA